jgi:hypothetical protein
MKPSGLALVIFVSCLILVSCFAAGQEQAPPAASQGAATTEDSGKNAPDSSSLAKTENPKPTLTLPDLTPDAHGNLSQEQMQALLRVVADKDLENDKRLRDYTYTERDVTNKLDGKGQTKSTEVRTYEVLEIYGEQVQRLIEKDGKPLDAKDAAKEDEKIQKIIDKRKNESEEERRKREAKEEKDREDERAFVRDVADAYNFKLAGTEMVGGREAWVIDGEPRPGFVPHAKDAKYLTKFRGRVWIDKDDLQLAKLDVECLDTISWGLFLARFHKGSRFMLEQTRVNNEVWLPRHVTFKLDARVALVKGFNIDGDQTYSDYKKFRTSAKIVGVGEVKQP